MAEIRKHNPDAGDGIGKLVREALGETIRPVAPGKAPVDEPAPTNDETAAASLTSLPSWEPAELDSDS